MIVQRSRLRVNQTTTPAPTIASAWKSMSPRPGCRERLLPAVANSRSIAPYSSAGAKGSSIAKVSRATWTLLKLRLVSADQRCATPAEMKRRGCSRHHPSGKRLAVLPKHELAPLSVCAENQTAIAGSPTSHSALPAPLAVSLFCGDCAPSALRKVPGLAVPAIGLVQFGLDTLKSPTRSADNAFPPLAATRAVRAVDGLLN